MKNNKNLFEAEITFKDAMMIVLLVAVTIPVISGLASKEGLDISQVITSVVGLGVSTPITYYFLNNRSFEPMTVMKFAITIVVNFILATMISMLMLYMLKLV